MEQYEAKPGSFSGTIDHIQLADLIQLDCLAGRDLTIEVESGSSKGCIYLRSGQLPNAAAGSFTGEDALFEMLRWKGGHFETLPLPEDIPVTIKRGWEYLLIEAMRLREEREDIDESDPELEGTLSLSRAYGFSGSIQNILLTDLIQLCCIAPMDRAIDVESEGEAGKILIQSGQVRHAQLGELWYGEEALFRILEWASGRFAVYFNPEGGPVSIETPWDSLLFESMRRMDESARAGSAEEEAVEESLYQKVQKMKVVEKVRLGMRGDKEARALLIRDPSKIIQFAVINNPRITEGEVAAIAHSRHIDEEVLRKIAGAKDWMKLYPIRLALATNPKTPLPLSMKLVPTLILQDLKTIAKSKAVPTAVSQAARRLVTARQE